ncbi:zf-TFIIB domain-containing protein [Lentibacter sp. XHP0401]|uniref:TFIIB-type zinc ribbon-containing protein n=1 Tax=Lentibacter sp. XHP0401 TaxID=2984334 RepID=UPI0021E8E4B8|nr:zf-TFIIB domain-containing protein [Lentibacter sp. XHP0401]MCV2894584.1 zf-TFIIB domain-containing protein [Lentibacter sp. XHP0401]
MKCPVDGELLVITERSGVEIDYCPRCRGVWLDRGELDKLIEVAGRTPVTPAPTPAPEPHVYQEPYRETRREEPREYSHGRRRKKRGGFADILEDLFDFD